MSSESVLERFLKVLFNNDEDTFLEELKKLKTNETFKLQSELWDYVMEEGQKKNEFFDRRDITRDLEPTTNYMHKVGCKYDEAYCRAKLCVQSSPNCATNKAIQVILVLRKKLLELKTVN